MGMRQELVYVSVTFSLFSVNCQLCPARSSRGPSYVLFSHHVSKMLITPGIEVSQ